MTILDTLASDHRQIENLFTDLAATPSSDPGRRILLFSKLQALLQAHSRAEEEVVYRSLHARLPEDEKPLEAYEEHHVADLLLQELASSCPGGPSWVAKAKVLEELLRHHIKEEELDLFALASEHFSEAELRVMDQEFRMLKHHRVETLLGPVRRATPAFAGRAIIGLQSAMGRYARRGELYVRRAIQARKRA